jgi:glycosyltransferase involved in cell wall biosynthesis
MILLSIITPVYNNVHYISLAIENYLSQDSKNTELIVMDGGSTDGTNEVIERYASKNSSIRWISEKDEGQSDAMNKGIQLAKGKYISFLNVDDYYSDGCLNEVCQLLTKNPSIRYLVGDCNVWDQFGKLIYVNRPSKLKKWHVFSGHHFSVNPSAYFYQKSLHDEVGFYPDDNHYNMDLEMILRFREVTEFHYYPRIWGNFRMLPNAKTFVDKETNQLEVRKQLLLKKYQKEQTYYIQILTQLYTLKRYYQPKLILLVAILSDKIKFETRKLFLL